MPGSTWRPYREVEKRRKESPMKRVQMFVILSVCLAAMVFPLAPARAVGFYEKYTEWYADATKTEVVGWRYQSCNGVVEAEGYVTAYRKVWFLDECADGGGGSCTSEVVGSCPYHYDEPYDSWICPAYCYCCYWWF
jgi:hypothetical protein